MSIKINEIDEHGEFVRDIIGQTPAWPINWGSTVIFAIMAIGILMLSVISYPDTIMGQAQISTAEPPIRIVSPVTAQLQKVFLSDGQVVREGQYIAQIKNILSIEHVMSIKEEIQETENFIKDPVISFLLPSPSFSLGDMQPVFNNLQRDVRNYTSFLNDNYFVNQIQTLDSQIADYSAMNRVSKNRLNIESQTLAKTKERFEAQKNLYDNKVISKFDYVSEEKDYNEVRQNLEVAKEEEHRNNISITTNKRQIEQLKFDRRDRERNLILNIQQSLLSIKNQIKEWERDNIIVAPISGKLSYLKRIVDKQQVSAQEELFAIVPSDSNYIAIVNVPTVGYGKIALGQRVQIRLDNYPPVQFGVLVGKVRKLSYLASERTYFAEVALPRGLTTNYLKPLVYHPEMGGTAEIVTEDLSLLARLFYSIKDIFSVSLSKNQATRS